MEKETSFVVSRVGSLTSAESFSRVGLLVEEPDITPRDWLSLHQAGFHSLTLRDWLSLHQAGFHSLSLRDWLSTKPDITLCLSLRDWLSLHQPGFHSLTLRDWLLIKPDFTLCLCVIGFSSSRIVCAFAQPCRTPQSTSTTAESHTYLLA